MLYSEFSSFTHPAALMVSSCWCSGGGGECKWGDQWWLNFTEDFGAKAQAVREFPETQCPQVASQSRNHP